MDKSWMREDRLSDAYDVGVKEFFKFVKDHMGNPDVIPCPCIMCGNVQRKTIPEVKGHLFQFGIDQGYDTWIFHEEECNKTDTVNPVVNEQNVEGPQFDMNLPDDAPEVVEMVEAAYEDFINDPEMFKKLLEDAEKPLYPSCTSFTKLSTLVKLYNLKASGAWSDRSFSDLLKLLKDMLPENNEIPISLYEAKKTMNALGLGYEKIHACPNDCVLYRKELINAVKCPTCNVSRWKMNKHNKEILGVPAKVLWYFPPIPRFKKMFQSGEIAKELRWHHRPRANDGRLRHPADSPAWKQVDHKWPDFAKEPRNLRLALSADGMNPHSALSSKYSCWPVLMVNYNLPPWLCMKRKFMMMSMLVSGPQQPGNDIDVYLEPLVDDLLTLWDVGVPTYDAYKQKSFTLRAALLWTINDFPAYGILSGCSVKGYNACPICAESTCSIRLKHSKKNVYMGHRKFLPTKHPFRKQKKAFNGEQEDGQPPNPLNGEEILSKVEGIRNTWGKKKMAAETSSKKKSGQKNKKGSGQKNKKGSGKKDNKSSEEKDKKRSGEKNKKRSRDSCEEDKVKLHHSCKKAKKIVPYWKKKSIFFKLPYWKHHLVRHCLDVMHITKNVGESLIGTLLNIPGKSKDGLNCRKDLEEMGLRTELAPDVVDEKRTFLPAACYTCTKEEKMKFLRTLYETKVPDGYCSNIRSRVSMEDLKLSGMKSHDYHTLMQQLLPLAIRSILPKHVRYAITRLCFFFNAICSREVDIQQLDEIQKNLVETVCLLEKYFPPSFFDIMIHLVVHLVREVKLCGPVQFRWMYPFERFMKVLKSYVRNRFRPEGCMAECYISEEAVEFCSEYLSGVETVGIPSKKRKHETDDINLVSEGRPLSRASIVEVDDASLQQAHLTVLRNTIDVEPYIDKHMSFLKKNNPSNSNKERWLNEQHNKTFIDWIRSEVENELNDPNQNISDALKWIAHGPRCQVLKYSGYDINGYRFRTKSRDDRCTTQNSGVNILANTMLVAGPKDDNPVVQDTCYYGVIQEIWLMDYNLLRIPVFKCAWVDSAGGIKVDELGFTLVELGNVGHKKDSFILASHAKQVFYVEDQLDPEWSIVIKMPERYYQNEDYENEVIDCQGDYLRDNNVMPTVNCFDIVDESKSNYVRENGEGIWIDPTAPNA